MVREQIEDIPDDDLYCTPEQVMEVMGIIDQYSGEILDPSDADITTRNQIKERIIAKMNEIDMLTKDSWREHKVKDLIYTVNTYWHDTNSWRMEYRRQGGWFITLRQNVCDWDIDKGDKLFLRKGNNAWRDISESVRSAKNPNGCHWIDNVAGKMYLNLPPITTTANAVKISYRYGKSDPVPMDIQRCCALLTGITLIQNQWYFTKIGTGGDLSSILQNNTKAMQDEANMIIRQHQRYGTFHSLYG